MIHVISGLARTYVAALVYVDSQGFATDDEGNRWQVNKSPGYYPRNQLPRPRRAPARKPTPQTPEYAVPPLRYGGREHSEWMLRISATTLAALSQGNLKACGWLSTVAPHSGMTERDVRWIETLEKRYSSILRSLPEISGTYSARKKSFTTGRLSDQQRNRLSRYFRIEKTISGAHTLYPL